MSSKTEDDWSSDISSSDEDSLPINWKLPVTENGALACKINSYCLEFFSTVMARDKATATDDGVITHLLENCWQENPLLTLKLIAHLRDCRGGKGERKAALLCFRWLLQNHPEQMANAEHLPFYGRWSDLLDFVGTAYESTALRLMADRLRQDKSAYLQGLAETDPTIARQHFSRISLCAKWTPTEKSKFDHIKGARSASVSLALLLMPHKSSSPSKRGDLMKSYRKEWISPLREALNLVERLLCARRYDDVDFSKVPSLALKHYSAKCFPKHMAERFRSWQNDVAKGKATINSSQVDPYEVVNKYLQGTVTDAERPTLEAFFQDQVKKLKASGSLGRTVCLVDVSGSMTGTPMAAAIALGCWISAVASPAWNLVFTFETTPQAVVLDGYDTLESRVMAIKRAPWGGSTNLQAVFQLILDRALQCNIAQEMMPTRLVILSDMQFDSACENTNLDEVTSRYTAAGYTVPEIVFWNVRGNGKKDEAFAAPARDDKKGVAMISGFSKDMINILLDGKPLATPYDLMINVLNGGRYDLMKLY